jgi:hypothetical protein
VVSGTCRKSAAQQTHVTTEFDSVVGLTLKVVEELPRLPKYCRHKGTGQAYVTLKGREVYLGCYNSPKSRERYDRLILEWRQEHDHTECYSLTVGQLCMEFLGFAAEYYRSEDGEPTTELQGFRYSLKPLCEMYRTVSVSEFGPRKLDAVRDGLIKRGLARSTINQTVGRIKRVFRWGVSRELVRSEILASLSALDGLKAGRSRAVEPPPVEPVLEEHVEAISRSGSSRSNRANCF